MMHRLIPSKHIDQYLGFFALAAAVVTMLALIFGLAVIVLFAASAIKAVLG